MAEIASPDHAVWGDLAAPEAARARLTLRTLLPGAGLATDPPSPAPDRRSSPPPAPEVGDLDI